MHRFDHGAARESPDNSAGAGAGDVAALFGWWALSGADTLTGDEPMSWFVAADGAAGGPAGAAAPARIAPTRRQPAIGAAAFTRPSPDPFADVRSLAALHAMVQAQHPNAPFADGNPASGILVLGDAPSAEDLQTGRPFSGPEGILLDRMLAAIGLDRTGCYIALLASRRRIPGPPPPDAVASDLPLARAHVRLCAPRHILLLGAAASHGMAGNAAPIEKLRGRWLEVDAGNGPVPALVTFSPAYLLHRPQDKGLAWTDFLTFRQRLAQQS
ncbi:MAG: uracil-DNA glycosylase [Sandarakinorhabdus sp.]|nr:uracil-DNA glycosylase [Sandarakinorhabdus sp.]